MILDEIIEHKRAEVAGRQAARPIEDVMDAAERAARPRAFLKALSAGREPASARVPHSRPLRLIAEIKGRSPSRGDIVQSVDPAAVAMAYEEGGASAISVLTDSKYFGGELTRIKTVKDAAGLPVLQKDFITCPYQVYEARSFGADAILLIVACLNDAELRDLHGLAGELRMAALVEAHTRDELKRAITLGARLIGINNRNLQTFEVSLETTIRLASLVPPDRVLVGESGIFTRADADRLADAGVDAMLVGESLMRAGNPAASVRELVG